MKYMMKYIVDNIDDIVLLDPSNTNNNIAETIKEAHKDKMKKYAKRALKCIENDSWKNIFDASSGQCLDKENSDVLKSAFTGIAAKPYAKVN